MFVYGTYVLEGVADAKCIINFEMQEINGALFLKANFLSYALIFGSVTLIVPLTTIYPSL